MNSGLSRRHWLLALLTGLGGSWLVRRWPAAAAPAAAVVPSCRSVAPPRTLADPLGRVTTYTYDSSGSLLLLPTPAPPSITTFTYEPRG